MKHKKTILTLLFILFYSNIFSQKEKFTCDFNVKSSIKQFGNNGNKETALNNNSTNSGKIRIPVIVHIYHHGELLGSGYNISENEIIKCIIGLNQAFSGGGKFSETIDTEIEFYLVRDSLNCTSSGIPSNGISRANLNDLPSYYRNQYFQGQLSSNTRNLFDKYIFNLSPNPVMLKCLNIRFIPFWTGSAGSVSPGDLQSPILQTNSNIGDSNLEVLVHEVGHVLGLSHTFSSNETVCGDGDGLSDTDPHLINDIGYPDEINLCTAKKYGKVISNFMSYGFDNPNFTPMQKDLMHFTLISFFGYDNLFPIASKYKSPSTKGIPQNGCAFIPIDSNLPFATSFGFELNNTYFNGANLPTANYLDYSCSSKFELISGQSYNFVFQQINLNPSVYYKVYIDFNDNGGFEDSSEMVYSGVANSLFNSGQIDVPNTAINNRWLRLRIIRSSEASFTSCSSSNDGTAIDFGIKILPYCIPPIPPIAVNQTIPKGGTAIFNSSGCAGITKWYSTGEFLATGSQYNTGPLNKTKYFGVTCTLNNCESIAQNISVNVNQLLDFHESENFKFCTNQNADIIISSSLESGVLFSVSLKKDTFLLGHKVSTATGLCSIFVPRTYQEYLNGPDKFVTYGENYNLEIEAIDPYTLERTFFYCDTVTIGILDQNGHRIVEERYVHYDPNVYDFSSDLLCNGKEKILYANAKKQGYGYSKEGITYTWLKDGSNIAKTNVDSFSVTGSGVYSCLIKQGSCSVSTNNHTIISGNNINNNVKSISRDYGCEDFGVKLYSDYSSNTAMYQWTLNNVNIPGAVLRNYNAKETGLYNVVVTEPGCNIFNYQPRTISITKGIPTEIFTWLNDSTFCNYNSFGFSFSNTIRIEDKFGGGLINPQLYEFQWQFNGKDLLNETKNFIDISDRPSPNSRQGLYRLKKTLGDCISFSNEIEITSDNSFPKPKFFKNNSVVSLNETVNNCFLPLVLNSGSIYSNNKLYLNNQYHSSGGYFNLSLPGSYKLIAGEGTTCEAESDELVVSITNIAKPEIKYYDINKKHLCGSSDVVILEYNFQGNPFSSSYQWYKNGVLIPGATNYSYQVVSMGVYSLSVSKDGCSSLSNPIQVLSNNSDIQLVSTNPNLGCSGGVSELVLEGKNHIQTIQLYKDSILTTHPPTMRFYLEKPGVYYVQYNDGSGCAGTTNLIEIKTGGGEVQANNASIPKGTLVNLNATGCVGGIIKWYETESAINHLSFGNLFRTPGLEFNSSYFFTCTKGGCENLVRNKVEVSLENCLTIQNLNSSNLSSGVFRAINTLNASINASDKTKFFAGKEIILNPGFQVGSNEVFEAKIEGCEN